MNKSRTINLAKALTFVVLLIGACLIALNARAELRCDCSQIVSACSAEVSFDANNIEIQSSVDACSRVDYLIDGQPYAALVVDGETEFNWDGQPQSRPQIVVENCRVCADRKEGNFSTGITGSTSNTSAADSDEDAGPRALIKVMPDYPRTAWGQSLEGSVTVEFSVNAEGEVHNIRVTDSTSTLFVNNTLDAVSRYRYAPEVVEKISERFDFRLLDGISPVVNSATL